MKKKNPSKLTLSIGSSIVLGLSTVGLQANPFHGEDLGSGYGLGSHMVQHAKHATDGKCGNGNCGAEAVNDVKDDAKAKMKKAKKKKDVMKKKKKRIHKKATQAKCGEGKCG